MKLLYQIFVLLFTLIVSAQDFTSESLQQMEDEELLELFTKVEFDSLKAEKVARTYLDRARKQKDTIKMARAYDRLARIFHSEKNIAFADSVIELTKDLDNITFPAQGYILKSLEYDKLNNLPESTKNFYNVYDYAIDNGNVLHQLFALNYLIHEKSYWGEKSQALEFQKYRHSLLQSPDILKKIELTSRKERRFNTDIYYKECLILSYFSFVTCYVNLKNFKHAIIFLDKARYEMNSYTGLYKDYFEAFSTISHMEIEFLEEHYSEVDKLKNLILDSTNPNFEYYLFDVYNFTGLSYISSNQYLKGISYLEKADSIYSTDNKKLVPYQREVFEVLLKHYESENDINKQLETYRKLLAIDSTFKANFKFFEPDIIRKFETPRLLAQKEDLINSLESKNNRSNLIKWFAIGMLGISIMSLFYYVKKQKQYKRRFAALLTDRNENDNKLKKNNKNELSTKVIENILVQLDKFEEKKDFLKQNVSLSSLSNSINTNPRYLSKVINLEKDKNFTKYINDLRIEYAVNQLLQNSKVRKYTIKAIAHEFGFKTSESFSKAFYKKHGIYPSYFLKNLEKNKELGTKSVLRSILKK